MPIPSSLFYLLSFPMFIFQPGYLQLAILLGGVLLAVFGLTHLALKRRGEILEDYLTPEEPDPKLEEDFFRRRVVRLAEQAVRKEQEDQETEEDWGKAEWGDSDEEASTS
ncbi:MAG: hypothetical protein ACRC10_09630 [Thermoguttaceae bacterium]